VKEWFFGENTGENGVDFCRFIGYTNQALERADVRNGFGGNLKEIQEKA